MERETSCITIRSDIKQRSLGAIEKGLFPGINNFSYLIEKALTDLLNETPTA